jgi:hypothetical protein
MPNPNAAPQQPGSMVMRLEPGNAKVEIDGYPLDQFITAMSISFSRTLKYPVLSIELLPSAVDVTAPAVEIRGDFRDFLVSHGWRPPE